jgi:hypothetical protein
VCLDVPGADCRADTDCVTPGPCEALPGICTAGKCDYAPDPCNTPAAGECLDSDSTYLGYYARGTCDPADGECDYTSFEVSCADCSTNCLGTCDAVVCSETHGGCASRGRCLPGSPAVCDYEQASDGISCEHQTSDDARCVDGECRDCGAGECAGVLGLGAVCTEPATCASGFCENGRCCESACGNGVCLASGLCGCTMFAQCNDGSICVNGACRFLCVDEEDCSEGESCLGDLCLPGPDTDGDGVADADDNCVEVRNAEQVDHDLDGLGDACDIDSDGDAIPDVADNCPLDANAAQVDTNADGDGDVCDDDDDGDGADDDADDCRLGVLGVDVCDDDGDADGIPGSADNCPGIYNPQVDGAGNQLDLDQDDIGDVCDYDMDGDGAMNWADNCITAFNPGQEDADSDGLGDACDNS